MKDIVHRWLFRLATLVENLGVACVCAAACGTLSYPFTVSSRETLTLDLLASAKVVGLGVAWGAGALSLACLWCGGPRNRAGERRRGTSRRWGCASIVLTLLATLLVALTPRVGAVAGPPVERRTVFWSGSCKVGMRGRQVESLNDSGRPARSFRGSA